jgi:ATP-dependent DNA helicase RecQ
VLLYRYTDIETQEFFISKIGDDNAEMDAATTAVLQARAREKLEMMVEYASGHRCRRQYLLDYFGDESEPSPCACDVCTRGLAASADADETTHELVRKVLSGIARLNGRFGIAAVAELLTGEQSERADRWNFARYSTFGILRAHPKNRVMRMLHRVLESGLARQIDPERRRIPVVELTPKGTEVMKNQRRAPALLADVTARPNRHVTTAAPLAAKPPQRARPGAVEDEALDDEGLQRFEKLRMARAELAREHELPAYVIAHDRTLRNISRDNPADMAGLERVKGMGPVKVRQYGQKLLAALIASDVVQ